MAMPTRFLAPLLAASVVTACTTPANDGFPSLARRDAERVSGSIRPAAPQAPPPALSPATGDRLAGLRQQAVAAHRLFGERRKQAAALTAAAQGAAVASESWAVAQVALADLEAARSEAMIALADLDSLYVKAAEAAAMSGGSPELDAVAAARQEVSGLIGEEDAVLAGLHGRLRS